MRGRDERGREGRREEERERNGEARGEETVIAMRPPTLLHTPMMIIALFIPPLPPPTTPSGELVVLPEYQNPNAREIR